MDRESRFPCWGRPSIAPTRPKWAVHRGRHDHHSLGLLEKRAFVEITPEMFYVKRCIPEAGNLISRPGSHDRFCLGDLRPLLVSVRRIPDRIARRCPRLLDSELRRLRNRAPRPLAWLA